MAGHFKFASHSKDKELTKVHFEIILKTAENVPTTGNVYVQWKRGSKNENKGESKHVPVKDKKAVFEEVLEISSTLYKIPKKGYESKNISFSLKEEKGKKGNTIAKTVIDLAEFAGKDEKRSFSLKSKKSKVAPTLTLHFKSKERALAPDEEVTETDNVTEEALSDDEEEAEDFTDDKDDTGSNKSGRSHSGSSAPAVAAKNTPTSTPDKPRDIRRDSVSNISSLDVEQLRAELEKAKKRTKELATENVDYEDKVKELTRELEDARKAKSSPGSSTSEKESELRKQVKDLTQQNSDKDEQIKKLKKEQEEAKQATLSSSSGAPSDKEAQMKKRLKELATENVDLEEQMTALKKELDEVKAQGGKRGEREDGLQKQVQISGLEREVDLLKRKSSDSTLIQEYKDKIDNYKDKLKTQQEDSDKKLTAARDTEMELRDRIRDLEESTRLQSSPSSSSANRGQDKDREKFERDLEREKESRKKAEKEAMKLREKLEELESSIGNGKHVSLNGKEGSPSSELELEKKVMSAVYTHIGQYSSEDGVSETALAVWEVLSDTKAYLDEDDEHRAVIDTVIAALKTACNSMPNDMNVLFYWLSTTCALLHMLRDESDAHSNNDRDPIIDGVYQPTKEPSPKQSGLQDKLEWLAFSVYKQLVGVICDKLEPVLAPVIIEKPLTDKKTQVKTSAVMRILDRVLTRTRNHYLYDAVVQQLFVQIFYFTSCHLVNIILQKAKLTPSIGFQIKLGLSHLEDWISQASGSSAERALLAPCSAQLEGLRDVGGVLVLDKALLADASTIQSIFKVLNLRQMKRLLEVFEPDQLAQGAVPANVRDSIATTWHTPQANSLPLLFDPSKIIAFSPQFD